MKIKLLLLVSSISLLIAVSCTDQKNFFTKIGLKAQAIKPEVQLTSKTLGRSFSFLIVSDWGWNGFKHQQEVADQMARTADTVDARFIASCGDNFQVNGVESTQDPLWMQNFENVYKGISLQADWYPVLGNHDYKGSPQAEIDYSKISRRWRLTDHYYSFAKKINDSVSARFIFLDTPPLIDEYQKKTTEYPEIAKQDTAAEMKWLRDVLSNSKEQWKLVFGHHPIYSASQKHGNTKEMIARVKPLLENYHAQLYFCGHDHDFQHLREKGQQVDYIVTGTGGEIRPNSTNEMSIFSKSAPGFSVVSFRADSIRICFIGIDGNIIYKYSRNYK